MSGSPLLFVVESARFTLDAVFAFDYDAVAFTHGTTDISRAPPHPAPDQQRCRGDDREDHRGKDERCDEHRDAEHHAEDAQKKILKVQIGPGSEPSMWIARISHAWPRSATGARAPSTIGARAQT